MVTADDVARVTIFANLGDADRARLARACADISLVPGEFAAGEGAEPALFAVLDGRIVATRLIDGVERVLGVREPGDIFGEVPVTLGTVFPVGFRADESSRVMRIEPRDYYAVAADAPEVAVEVGRLAQHRMTGARGLSGIASESAPPRAIVIGDRWDADCGELRRFLSRNQISHTWLPPDGDDSGEQWGGPVPTAADLPAIRVIGGKTVIRPQLRRVAELLGLSTEPATAEYDTVVVGAGPAGLAAGVYGSSEGLRTIVIERQAPGGQAGTSARIENYLGFPLGVSGEELAGRALQQARRLGAEILVTRTITRIDAETKQIHLDGGDVLRARSIILACGVSYRHLVTEGFERLQGKGIFYGAARSDAPNAHGLDVHIIGAGNSAGQAALNFSAYARRVTIICRGDAIEKTMSRYLIDQLDAHANIDRRLQSEVVAAYGDDAIEAIDVRDNKENTTTRVESGGVFMFIGADAETAWLPPEIALDPRGFVLTGAEVADSGAWDYDRDPYLLETSVPGIFACGDVRSGSVKRCAAAVGEGSMSIAFVHQHLRHEEDAAARSGV